MWRRFRKPYLQLSRSSQQQQQQLVCYEEFFALSSLICSHTRNTDFGVIRTYNISSIIYWGTISDCIIHNFLHIITVVLYLGSKSVNNAVRDRPPVNYRAYIVCPYNPKVSISSM